MKRMSMFRDGRRRVIWSAAFALGLLLLGAASAAEETEDDDDELRNGLVAHYRDHSGAEFARAERTIVVPTGDGSPNRRLSDGEFSVRWQGFLSPPDSGAFRFYAHVSGHVRIKLRDRVILDQTVDKPGWLVSPPVELEFDYIPFDVSYQTTNATTKFALFWTGPKFPLEPISPRNLFHEPKKAPDRAYARGEQMVRAFRCVACHVIPGEAPELASPSLEHLAANVREPWLVNWLSNDPAAEPVAADAKVRRMPHFAFAKDDARAVAAFLLSTRNAANAKTAKPPSGSSEKGKTLFLTLGCLACHKMDDHGSTGLFVGGNLTKAAEKRPAAFFEAWLRDPASLNKRHRMPLFELSDDERKDLATFLATCGQPDEPDKEKRETKTAEHETFVKRGRELFEKNRCAACHEHAFPKDEALTRKATQLPIKASANWDASCLGVPALDRHRPGFRLVPADGAAVRTFITTVNRLPQRPSRPTPGRQLMIERNCVACHARDDAPGLAPKLIALIGSHPELAIQVPAMTPPALLSVGDKLRDDALVASIRRTQPVHRPWLKVRMPKFALGDEELKALVNYLVTADRIEDDAPVTRPFVSAPEPALHVAGSRLVTVDGFGCTSCHQIGNVKPVNAPQNARGPDLSQLGQRIRLPWFDRWVRNPARIVPGMEMPSVQLAVRGVLDEDINRQLAAVWQVLNTPGFEPPEPNPVLVLRLAGLAERNEWAEIVTDVLRDGERTLISPLLIGLPNRHSALFDLERNQLARWSIGDVARLRTKGKAWYWEAAGTKLWGTSSDTSEIALHRGGQMLEPVITGQFPTELDEWRHVEKGLEFRHRLRFGGDQQSAPISVNVQQRFIALFAPDSRTSGFRRELTFENVPVDAKIVIRPFADSQEAAKSVSADRRSWRVGEGGRVVIASPHVTVSEDGTIFLPSNEKQITQLQLEYLTDLPVDQFVGTPAPQPPVLSYPLKSVPGFAAARLPLPEDQMPTALAWQPDGTLLVASLKGRVWRARDTNNDGLEDAYTPFSDELAVPYGLATGPNYVDVITKFALLRLYDDDGDGRADRAENVASGWGHTADYHDWAIGLPRDAAGNYYVGLPCQQDKRSAEAAKLRGTVLKLAPREPTAADPRRYAIEPMTAGHRFPMGLALTRGGDLFVTDNQGNYNPFNELNHVRRGAHFGFINAIEKSNQNHPPATPAAVELPHPWTRSVNGICFLNTPAAARKKLGRDAFGPFEGHLVGAEYDTRRLIRISLQAIGDTFQGAAYPLSSEKPDDGPAMLGPLCCEVSPAGDLYVGSIRDSGWGGGNNIGEVVRLRFDAKTLPAGIAEMRAVRAGFEIDFTSPVDAARAAETSNYSLISYRRTPTPAYGGPDQDRRTDRVTAAQVAPDARRVTIQIAELREGFVYELRMKNMAIGKQTFFPSEAYFTLRKVP